MPQLLNSEVDAEKKQKVYLPLNLIYILAFFTCLGAAIFAGTANIVIGLYSMIIVYFFFSLFSAVFIMVITLLGNINVSFGLTIMMFLIPIIFFSSPEAGLIAALIPGFGGIAVGLLLKKELPFNSIMARGSMLVFGFWVAGGAALFYSRLGSGFFEAAPTLILNKFILGVQYFQTNILTMYPTGSTAAEELNKMFSAQVALFSSDGGLTLLIYAILYIAYTIMAGVFTLLLIGKKLTVFKEKPFTYPPISTLSISRFGGAVFLIASAMTMVLANVTDLLAFNLTVWFINSLLQPVFFVAGIVYINNLLNVFGIKKAKRRLYLTIGGCITVLIGFLSIVSIFGAWSSLFYLPVSTNKKEK